MTTTGARRAQRRRTVPAKPMIGRRMTAGLAGAGVALGSVVVLPSLAQAAVTSIEVTTLSDDGPGSLRAALGEALATSGDDQITFAAEVTGTIALTSGQLDIPLDTYTGGVDIQGPGAGTLTIDAGGQSRIFDIRNSDYYGGPLATSVTVSGLTLTGGAPTSTAYYDPSESFPESGGAVRVSDVPLTLDAVVVTDNTGQSGGAVSMSGADLTVASSTLSGNHASNRGGAIHFYSLYGGGAGTVTVNDSTLEANTSADDGGAISSGGAVSVTGSVLRDNTAKSPGYFYDGIQYYEGRGGAIAATDVTLVDSRVTGNEAGRGGGGVQAGRTATITGSTVSGNTAGGSGGGLAARDVTMRASTISGNTARSGGGGLAVNSWYAAAESSLTDSTIAGNRATWSGGGIEVNGDSAGVVVTGSTLAGNVADSGGGVNGYSSYYGGGGSGVTLQSTVVAGNVGGDLGSGDFTLDHSLVQDPAGAATTDLGGAVLGVDPLLGPLADNGGPTRTMLLASNSPAVDQGGAFGSTTDQRGKARPVDDPGVADAAAGADIGAVELDETELGSDPMIASTSRPSISGDPMVGQTLTADGGTWDPAPTSQAYQWLRDGAPISGATSSTYAVTEADLDTMLSVRVTASAAGHLDNTQTSDAVGPVAPVEGTPVVFTSPPTISGQPEVGSRLTASPGSTTPSRDVGFSYRWLRDGSPIAGATSRRYLLSSLDEGTLIAVEVRASKDRYDDGTATSDPVGPVSPNVAEFEHTVTNTADAGAGSLRQALAAAESSDGDDLITFESSVSGTINLTSGALVADLRNYSYGYGYDYEYGSGTLEIRGPGAGTLTIDAGGASGVLDLSDEPVTISGVTISGGAADSGAGVTMRNAPLTLERVVVRDNHALYDGGGVAASDGALIVRSTISGNTADGDGGGAVLSGYYGVQVSRSTVSGNTAGGQGGGLMFPGGDVGVASTTVADNTAPDGGGVASRWADVRLTNSVVGGNTGGDLAAESSSSSYYYGGSFTSEFSLVQNPGTVSPDDAGGSIFGADPLLEPLAANGGPTPTMLPGAGSPVVDQGKAFGLTSDQRGLARPVDAPTITDAADGSDMGAVELQGDELSEPMVANSAAPTVTGTARVGETLTAGTGTWSPTPDSFAYQWLRDGTEIVGATSSTHALVAGDRGAEISVRVTATKTGYADGTATSDPVGPVAADEFDTVGTPTVSGTARVGETLTAGTGSWSPTPDSFAYQWLRDGSAISGATSATYALVAADEGRRISVRVTARKAGFTDGTATSAQTAAVAPEPVVVENRTAPTVTGTTMVGETLSTDGGTWDPADATLSYQWLRAGTPISGATGASYALTASDLGKTIAVKVTASRAGATPVSKTSAATEAIRKGVLAMSTGPKVAGKLKVGKTLTAKPNLDAITPSALGVKISWYLNNKLVKSNNNKTKLKLTQAMRGKTVKVKFVYKPPAAYLALKRIVKRRGQIR